MAGVNKVILLGNLGADPEVRFTPSGQAVATFSLATNDSWTDKNGQKQERTEWHKIVVWEKLAELCGQYLAKGRQCYLEGKLQTREWTDKEGKKNYTTEVVARQVVFLGSRDGAGAGGPRGGGGGNRGRGGSDEFGPPPSGSDDLGGGSGGGGGGSPSGGGEDDIPF